MPWFWPNMFPGSIFILSIKANNGITKNQHACYFAGGYYLPVISELMEFQEPCDDTHPLAAPCILSITTNAASHSGR